MIEDLLRITFVGLNYQPEPTGIAPYSSGLARGLAARGHRVKFVTAFPHYPQWRVAPGYSGLGCSEVMDGVQVQRVRHHVPRGSGGHSRAFGEATFGARAVAAAWGEPDVVICISPALIASSMVVARARVSRGAPATGLHIQDLYSAGMAEARGGGLPGRALASLESWTARKVDGVSVIHDRFKNRICAELDVPVEAVSVIRNWTHLAPRPSFDRRAFRHASGWAGKHVVLHAGAMGDKQGLENVVAAARVASARGWPLHFVLVGDGKNRSRLEILSRGVSSLEILDPLPEDEFHKTIHSADVLLVNEKPGVVDMAVPSKLTSYFSTGLPVLAATEPNSTTSEEIAASGAGMQIRPGDAEVLARAAMSLCEDTIRAESLGSRGPRYCAEVLSEENALNRYEVWIRGLMRRARVRRGEA